ncbi:MAG: FMN-binding protein [Culicoidibacterales bacterium]
MNSKKPLLALIAFVVACVMVVLVGSVTTPLAQEKAVEAKKPYFKVLYPSAKQFSAVAVNTPLVTSAYIAEQNGVKLGLIYELVVNGYKDDIVFYVAINQDGTLEKPVYATINETPGIGTKIETDSDFTDQFLETDVNDFYLDTISSATISSQAVITATEAAVRAFEQMQTLLD